MHELSIAQSLLEAVRAQAEHRPGAHIVKVGLRVGELAGVNAEALGFCFESLVRGTELDPLALEIELGPRRQCCSACGHTFAVADFRLACPQCGAAETQCVGGEELEMTFLEVEP
jgi:hydrogenase nickel incorporation protein HypA/HybF